MSGFLDFHKLAAARGDGLHPRLLELLEQRALTFEGDPDVVELHTVREGAFTQAGPGPSPVRPAFLPGNVIDFIPRRQAAAVAQKMSSNS
ncbi:MAG: hypothetical protein KL840_03100 [Aquamicrobium sp.]|nr:hypothetical protein [Aquamicrobium sp.]